MCPNIHEFTNRLYMHSINPVQIININTKECGKVIIILLRFAHYKLARLAWSSRSIVAHCFCLCHRARLPHKLHPQTFEHQSPVKSKFKPQLIRLYHILREWKKKYKTEQKKIIIIIIIINKSVKLFRVRGKGTLLWMTCL